MPFTPPIAVYNLRCFSHIRWLSRDYLVRAISYSSILLPSVVKARRISIRLEPSIFMQNGHPCVGSIVYDSLKCSAVIKLYVYPRRRDLFLRALLHELTHLDQYISQRLIQYDRNTACWNGKYYEGDCLKTYLELPWEQEAFANERHWRKLSTAVLPK